MRACLVPHGVPVRYRRTIVRVGSCASGKSGTYHCHNHGMASGMRCADTITNHWCPARPGAPVLKRALFHITQSVMIYKHHNNVIQYNCNTFSCVITKLRTSKRSFVVSSTHCIALGTTSRMRASTVCVYCDASPGSHHHFDNVTRVLIAISDAC